MQSHRVNHRRIGALAAGALALGAMVMSGCYTVGALFGGMADSFERTGSREVAAKYTGLRGKSFAVVVAADRVIQADFPTVVGDLTLTMSKRMSDEKNDVGASGYVPGETVLEFQYNNPRWVAMTMEELAAELGVQRLVLVDLQEFRLNDPGNAYQWAAVATGTVRVVEADGLMPSTFAFQEPISVKFPDQEGLGPMQIPQNTVQLALTKRFIDRAAWLFYTHEEPNALKY